MHSAADTIPRISFPLMIVSVCMVVSALLVAILFPGFEVHCLAAAAAHPGVRRRPLQGSSAGAQFKEQAGRHGSAPTRLDHILPEVGDVAVRRQVKSTEGLLLHVILQTAADLEVNDPIRVRELILGHLEGSL